jgi:hypothetical protein
VAIEHEVEDIEILNEKPTVFWIGKSGNKKKLIIEMLSISKYYDKFIPLFVGLLQEITKVNEDIQFPSGKQWKSATQLEKVRKYFQSTFSHKAIRKYFIKMVYKVGYLENMSLKFFEKYVKPVVLIDIFLYIYKHNIDGFKKKLLEAVEVVLGSGPLSVTSTGSLSKKVGRQEKLEPRFRRLAKSKSPS